MQNCDKRQETIREQPFPKFKTLEKSRKMCECFELKNHHKVVCNHFKGKISFVENHLYVPAYLIRH